MNSQCSPSTTRLMFIIITSGMLLNPGVPSHFQNYRTIEQGQPIYCPIPIPSLCFYPAATLSKPSDADSRQPRPIFEPRQQSLFTYRVWVSLATSYFFFLATCIWRVRDNVHPSPRSQASLRDSTHDDRACMPILSEELCAGGLVKETSRQALRQDAPVCAEGCLTL